MRSYVLLDPEGYPLSGGTHPVEIPPGAVELPQRFPLSALGTIRIVDGRIEQRPSVAPCEETAEGVAHSNLPPGTVIQVMDQATDRIISETPESGGSVSSPLPVDGEFLVRIEPPRPYLAVDQVITRGTGSDALAQMRLDEARAGVIDAINAAIGTARVRYFTNIAGQEMLYLEKRSEAKAYASLDPEPETLADFPLLAAETGVTAPTAWQLAQIWLNMGAALIAAAAGLERARMTAIMAIEAAADEAAIEAAVAAFRTAIQPQGESA